MKEKIWERYAIDIFKRIERGDWLEPLLRKSIDSGKIPPKASRFVSELCYGVIRNIYLLRWIAKNLVGEKKWDKLPDVAKWIILMGLYQLRFHSPEKAPFVCFRLVELSKRLFHAGIASLVNAVLRNYIRVRIEPPLEDIATRLSYPNWLVEDLLSYFKDEAFVVSLLEKGNQRPKMYLHINLKKTNREKFASLLKERNIDFEELSGVEGCFLIKTPVFPRDIPGWSEGLFWMQSLSSILAVKSLDIKGGDFVLDLCAGRGVKSADIAQRLNGKGMLVSIDLYPWKLKILRDFLNNLSYNVDALIAMDLQVFNPKLEKWASKVMLDVPCSNLADVGGKPEIKLRITPESIRNLVKLQLNMIEVASKYVRSGGYLVYSTCTFFPEENEEVIKGFLNRCPEYEILNLDWVEPLALRVTEYGYYIEDGFIALLVRR
ncbi:MAG: hypothetical protein H5T91_05480 [Synergistetes bacterium]|nr:hypothetical protein [Synergistota bacterium]